MQFLTVCIYTFQDRTLRAAFPLDFYENRMACVVSSDVFDDLSGYVMIFHEFIHCAQMENGEPELKNELRVARCRSFLRELLNALDYEYMVWQEWKEGFARLIENRLRNKLELAENRGGIDLPFNRVTFYEGGERYISLLFGQNKELEKDIETLFRHMLNGQVQQELLMAAEESGKYF